MECRRSAVRRGAFIRFPLNVNVQHLVHLRISARGFLRVYFLPIVSLRPHGFG